LYQAKNGKDVHAVTIHFQISKTIFKKQKN